MMEGLDILLVGEISHQKQRYASMKIVYTSIYRGIQLVPVNLLHGMMFTMFKHLYDFMESCSPKHFHVYDHFLDTPHLLPSPSM